MQEIATLTSTQLFNFIQKFLHQWTSSQVAVANLGDQ